MTSKFTVFVHLPAQSEAVPAGLLDMLEDGSRVLRSTFLYGGRYVERHNRLALDPLTLQLTQSPTQDAATLRDPPLMPQGLLTEFGVFRDAAPDNWGRRVIENKLGRLGALPESTYLQHAGNNRTGALDFRDKHNTPPLEAQHVGLIDLEYLLEASDRVQTGERLPGKLALLFDAGSSMGGARPKAVIVADGKEWLAKFGSTDDRFDVPCVEYATMQMARAAGLSVPALRLERVNHRHVMLIERFDREYSATGVTTRRHFVSALTLMAKHESESSTASYQDIALAITRHGARSTIRQDLTEIFKRMVFNILVNNNDDHLRNHGFLWDPVAMGWRLSPLYDVVPTPVIAHTRYLHLGVGQAGRLATLENAISQYGIFGLSRAEAENIINQITMVVREWRVYFEDSGVKPQDIEHMAGAIRHPREVGWHDI